MLMNQLSLEYHKACQCKPIDEKKKWIECLAGGSLI